MTFVESIQTCIQKYFVFTGRASRSEFWWFAGFRALINTMQLGKHPVLEGVFMIISLALVIPMMSVASRRLHDIGRSGWWQALIIIPLIMMIIGMYLALVPQPVSDMVVVAVGVGGVLSLIIFIWLIVWFAKKGNEGENRFGPTPL